MKASYVRGLRFGAVVAAGFRHQLWRVAGSRRPKAADTRHLRTPRAVQNCAQSA